MKKNALYNELKSFLDKYHPNLSGDIEFIESRSELAQQTFIDSSKSGNNVEDSMRDAREVLYNGLHFSVYQLINDIIEEEFPSVTDIETFGLKMYEHIQPILSEYHIDDQFERSSKYDDLYNRITGIILEYTEQYGIQ